MTGPLAKRCLAEATGTAILVGVGTGAIVAGVSAGGVPQWFLAIAWFAAVAIPVLLFANVSGAHINPAITLALTASRRFPLREAGPYALAQFAGAFGGSMLVLTTLGSAAHIGSTIPRDGDLIRTFILEFAFTLALVLSVFYLTTPGKLQSRWELLLPAMVVGISTNLIGPWTGSSLNPARTLAPAALSGDYYGIWVYFLALPLSALSGAILVHLWARWTGSGSSEPPPGTPGDT